jgi:hypothetical protein
LCLVVVALHSAEGFGVQRVEVLETGGEPALAEWLGLWATGFGTAVTALERRRRLAPDGYRRLRDALILLNKNVYMLAEVCSGSVLLVWFGRSAGL